MSFEPRTPVKGSALECDGYPVGTARSERKVRVKGGDGNGEIVAE